jgi:AcrR family transcriptional regulator
LTTRKRDPERSRTAILDAAEQVFARYGFDRASLAQIGRAGGVSATLPAYFFTDKQGLYDAVIARLFAERDLALEPVCAQSLATLGDGPDGLRPGLEILVGGYLRFLQQRPTFVQLISREALEIPRRAEAPRHSRVLERGIDQVVDSLPHVDPGLDRGQLLITVVALCWFPLEHDATMLAGMGYATWTDAFVAARRDHVVDVLMALLAATPSGERAAPARRARRGA